MPCQRLVLAELGLQCIHVLMVDRIYFWNIDTTYKDKWILDNNIQDFYCFMCVERCHPRSVHWTRLACRFREKTASPRTLMWRQEHVFIEVIFSCRRTYNPHEKACRSQITSYFLWWPSRRRNLVLFERYFQMKFLPEDEPGIYRLNWHQQTIC